MMFCLLFFYLRVEDLRHLLRVVFIKPDMKAVFAEGIHRSIVDIVARHDAKEPLFNDDLTFVE